MNGLKNFIFDIQRFADSLLITGTAGDNNISNALDGATINAYGGNDSIDNRGENLLIDAGSGNDTIYNWSNYTTIALGTGNDSIQNYGENVSIDGGAGSDYINNYMQYVTINGGADNDYIVASSYNSISGGNGNDTIYLSTGSASGGAGDDYVKIDAMPDNLIQYTSGDGNDLIEGFNETSTLQIGGGSGTYSTQISGSDIVVTVGEGKITLAGAASLSKVNIQGTYVNPLLIVGTEGADTINNIPANATVNALGGNDYISYMSSNVSINAGAGNDSIYGCSKDSKIDGGAGNDYIEHVSGLGPDFGNNTLLGGTGNDTVSSDCDNVTIDGGEGDDYIVNGNTDSNGYNVSINGGEGNNTISNHGSFVTIRTGSGADNVWSDHSNNLIDTGAGNDNIDNDSTNSTINAGEGDDFIQAGERSTVYAGAGKDSVLVGKTDNVIFAQDGDDRVTIENGNNITVDGGSGNDMFINNGGNQNITFTYTAGDGNDTIYGFNETSTLSISGGTYSTQQGSKKDIIVTVSEGSITLKDAANLSAVNINGEEISLTPEWTLSGTTATYGTANETLITVTGVKSLDGISLSGTTVTIAKASVDAKNITISDGYTLKLADDVTKSKTTNAWAFSGTTATYNQTTSAGYTLTNNEIIYSKKSVTSLATVEGVTSKDGFTIDEENKIVTVSTNSLGTSKVTISNGYNLALADDVTKTNTTNAWAFSGTTATYNQTTTAGYTLTNNEIIYSKKSTTPLATVEGVTSKDGLSLSGKVVTVSKTSLGTNEVTISDGYTLALADDVETSSTIPADWSLEGTTATYFSESTNEGYTLADNAITYSEGTTAAALVTVKGVKASTGLSLNGTVVTVAKASLTNKNITVSDGYTLKLAKNVAAPSTLEADWTLDGTTATYFSESKTKGYTPASDSKSIKYSKAVAEKSLAQIDGVTSTDGLTISGNTIKATASGLAKNISVSSDSYVFDFASDYKKVTISGGEDDETIKAAGQRVILSGGAGDDSIFGSGKYNSINAGIGDNYVELGAKASNSTVRSEGGNDTVSNKASNALIDTKGGKDLIVNEGASTTIDSGAGNDSIANSGADVSISAGNVIFKIGSGQITVQDAADKLIAYEDANGVKRLYPVEFNSTYTGATLRSEYGKDEFISSNYTDYGTLKTVDASAVEHDMTIEGNKEANRITGSTQDDFINGYSGADVLYGGAGADTLAGSGGNDKLFGEAGNDSLSGGSGEDTLEGGKGRDSLTGGSGADVFSFNVGDGANVITDYNEAQGDKISINAAASSVKYEVGKSNVLFTFGTSDRVTLKNSAEQAVTWIDEDGVEHVINDPKTVIYNNAGTGATLTSFYEDDAFTPDNYSDYATTLKTIDASAVEHDLTIGGNAIANNITGSDQNDTIDGASGADTIYGGDGNDSLVGSAGNDYLSGGDGHNILWGGADNDTLVGGEGYNTFIYNDGDGKDVIEGYRDGYDTIILNSGKIEALYEDGNDVVFEIGTGSITVKDAKSQVVALYDSSGNMYRPYHRANAN